MDINMKNGKIIIYITASSMEEGNKIAKQLVEKRLAACCNIIPEIKSLYWWEGKICEDKEVLILVKTVKEAFGKIVEEVKKIHSYDVPEIICSPIEDGYNDYLNWIEKEVNI